VTGSRLLAVDFLSAHNLLASFGAIGVFPIMFAETGLLVGIFSGTPSFPGMVVRTLRPRTSPRIPS
jgi:hypothetical protein